VTEVTLRGEFAAMAATGRAEFRKRRSFHMIHDPLIRLRKRIPRASQAAREFVPAAPMNRLAAYQVLPDALPTASQPRMSLS